MLAVPAREEDNSLLKIVNRIVQAKWFQVISSKIEENVLKLEISFEEETYSVDICITKFEIPELYRIQHLFPDVDLLAMEQIHNGIGVTMEFGKNALVSYYLQLRIIHAILPDKLAVLDDSSEKVLSGQWVALAAESNTLPAPRYLYTVQAVSDQSDCVWLHSHGLSRCGLTELEILNSNKEMYQTHYSIIETFANRMLEMDKPLEAEEPLLLARLSEDISLIAVFVDWEEAVDFYDEEMLGGKKDRKESHNQNTSAVFVYQSQEDYENGRISPVYIYDDILKENPIYLISTKETERMKTLAAERLSYVHRALADKENHILVKLGLTVDEEYRTESNSKEHIWFELLELKNNQISAKLTQEPYYISGLHEGDVGSYACDQITDWLIFTPERRLTPDDVYLMEY